MANLQMTRNAKLIALDKLKVDQQAAYDAIETQRVALQSDITALTAQITEAVQGS